MSKLSRRQAKLRRQREEAEHLQEELGTDQAEVFDDAEPRRGSDAGGHDRIVANAKRVANSRPARHDDQHEDDAPKVNLGTGRGVHGPLRGPAKPPTANQRALQRLADDMPVREVTYQVPPKGKRESMRNKFNGEGRVAFLKDLAENHEQELRAAGFSSSQMDSIAGGKVPKGWSVHHKLPIHGGGTNDFSNLILIKSEPHAGIHAHLDPIVSSLTQKDGPVRVPIRWPEGVVHIPGRGKARAAEATESEAVDEPQMSPAMRRAAQRQIHSSRRLA